MHMEGGSLKRINKILKVVCVLISTVFVLLMSTSCLGPSGIQSMDKTDDGPVIESLNEDLTNPTNPSEDDVKRPSVPLDIPSEDEYENANQTGYDDGGLQQPYIYYNGQLYMLEKHMAQFTKERFEQKEKFDKLQFLGVTCKETNHKWPSADLEASRIPEGTKIYYDGRNLAIYAYMESGSLFKYYPYHGEQYPLDKS